MTLQRIQKIIGDYLMLKPRHIQKDTNEHENVLARQLCCYYAKKLTSKKNREISEFFSDRTPSIVPYSFAKILDYIDTDRTIRKYVDDLNHLFDPDYQDIKSLKEKSLLNVKILKELYKTGHLELFQVLCLIKSHEL